MRIITLNVNGIRSAASKGVFPWMLKQKPDVVCLQETKAQEHHAYFRILTLFDYSILFDADNPFAFGQIEFDTKIIARLTSHPAKEWD